MKSLNSSRLPVLTLFLALIPALAQAHPGHSGAGFFHGVAHPLTGIDHILAMLAVGIWAVQCGGRALWAAPLAFVTVMICGGAVGMSGIAVPFAEQAIVASVLVLGLLIVTAARLPLAASLALVGGFAFFHGYAHGAEMPISSGGFDFAAGFALATLALHGAGVGLGLALASLARAEWIRIAGGAIAAGGGALALGWL